ncbi:type I-E CRISPR-associated protein Cse1/CasA [Actinomadura spongiicola]|uniref:Type I-E CRISPR-associated protein Cse1/CasA n=1 Tax=Actinomadura spongiicola TaxID=2303421 RepID=A0A372G8G9_9ACTN|nr:type I-E CRISPR-associated protein Cse1/CasA [Actinomadura spongiicola]RFS81373.1 type I-E CRISPR-associated protein Cse1/CasA [Actinomadura spongiicola]
MPPTGSDLATDGLIPVYPSGGVGLRELMTRAHELLDIDIPMPPAAAGFRRILTVFAARITGLDRQDDGANEWFDRRDAVLDQGAFDLDAVTAYFDRYRDRFNLFHPERPWLQDPRLATECDSRSGINKLTLERPAGNNQVWLDHHHDGEAGPLDLTTALFHLVAQLFYGPSGRCTARTVNGKKYANTTAGPLRRVVSFHPLGRNLFESLVIGIPFLGRASGDDRAPWEYDELPDPLGVPPSPVGVGGVLTGLFRHALLLEPDPDRTKVVNAYFTWGWRQPHPMVNDPYLIYQANNEGEFYPRRADLARALWRDLDALLREDVGVRGGRSRRPAVFGDAAECLPFDIRDALRVRAYGFHQDGQTRDQQWFAATTPAVLGTLIGDHETAGELSRARDAAERAEWHLQRALRNAWIAINDPSNGDGRPVRRESDIGQGPWPGAAAGRYWPRAEAVFWRRLRHRDFEDAARSFVNTATAVFDEVTEPAAHRPRAKRSIERARGFIYRALNESTPRDES